MRSAQKFEFEVHAERPPLPGSSLTSCMGRNLERRSQMRFDPASQAEVRVERPLLRGSPLTSRTGRYLEGRS